MSHHIKLIRLHVTYKRRFFDRRTTISMSIFIKMLIIESTEIALSLIFARNDIIFNKVL